MATRSKLTKSISGLLLSLLLLCGGTRFIAQQPAPLATHQEALAKVSDELKSEFGDVRFHREEDLEDRFIVHGLSPAALKFSPHFFQIQTPRFDTSKGFVEENVSNKLPTMYVATSADGAKAYRLYGFPNPEKEFGQLVANSPEQTIKTTGEAEMRGLLCAEAVYGLSSQWWLAGASTAEVKASEHFFDSGHEDGLRLGEEWWKSLKPDHENLEIHTTKDDTLGFTVSVPIFWAPVEGDIEPQIKIYRINVSGSGACHLDIKSITVLK